MSSPTTQVVRPAGAGHETLNVLLLCLLILAVAGSFLMRVGTDANAAPDIWLKRSADSAPAEDLSDAALSAAGWKQIVAQFDAGVTREHRH